MNKKTHDMQQKIYEIARQMTDLTKLALNTDLSGDEISRLYDLRHNIELALYRYLKVYNQMVENHEKMSHMFEWCKK